MKRVFFLNKVLIIVAFFCLVSCNTDSVMNDNMTEELNEKRLRPSVTIGKTVEILIEYAKGVSEEDKKNVRYQYIKTGLLLSWEVCTINSREDGDGENDTDTNTDGNDDDDTANEADIETWTVDYEIFYADDPVVTLPTDLEDVERATVNANCKKYK